MPHPTPIPVADSQPIHGLKGERLFPPLLRGIQKYLSDSEQVRQSHWGQHVGPAAVIVPRWVFKFQVSVEASQHCSLRAVCAM